MMDNDDGVLISKFLENYKRLITPLITPSVSGQCLSQLEKLSCSKMLNLS
jgi:hypothetical protein